jgi:hypothetical protein
MCDAFEEPRRSVHPDRQMEVPEIEGKFAASDRVHDPRQQNDDEDDHDNPDEEHDESRDGITAQSDHGRTLAIIPVRWEDPRSGHRHRF